MKKIPAKPIKSTTISVPGSKSISHRALICASLCRGRSILRNLLTSEDIQYTSAALKSMGALMQVNSDGSVVISGFGKSPSPCSDPIFLGNSGTSMRLLAGIAGIGATPYVLTGDTRMQERPMEDLLKALRQAGVDAESTSGNGCPPVCINGLKGQGGTVELDCSQSSQYLSSLLMAGPFFPKGLDIVLPSPAVSAPYIQLTLDMMNNFGVKADVVNELQYHVSGNQNYLSGDISIEPDISNAGYFWAAGAVTGKPVTVAHISENSSQGDMRLLEVFEKMGCAVEFLPEGVRVSGKDLTGVEVDMSDIPDVVPTLAIVAMFAQGTTTVTNIAHLREKECDRINAVVTQLQKMGVAARQGEDWLSITGGKPHGASIETFNDHRIAMAFAVSGLRVDGMIIENPGCVAKSFPTFWETFDLLYA